MLGSFGKHLGSGYSTQEVGRNNRLRLVFSPTLLSCSSHFLRALQQNRVQSRLLYLLDIVIRTNFKYSKQFEYTSLCIFRKATACDANLQILMSTVLEGWPSTENRVPQEIKSYFCCREDITVQNGLLFKGERIIVPSQLRKEMMGRRRFTRPTWVWKDVSAVQGSVLAIGPG